MRTCFRSVLFGSALAFVLCIPHNSTAQLEPFNLKFNSGQNVAPIFQGWSRTPDGSFTMRFGYLNRNFVEELSVPIGPDNNIEPGGPDRGQPTYFYTRIHKNLFSVTVPKDWGKKELVWTLVVHGKTEKAVGWLQPEWEIDPVSGGGGGRLNAVGIEKNVAPTLVVETSRTAVTLPGTLTLAATVTDDGLPKMRPAATRAVGQETPPTLKGPSDAPINVPDVAGKGRNRNAGPRQTGVSVTWTVWRGPAGVTFSPELSTVKESGKPVVTAAFTKPGEYVLRGRAYDGMLATEVDVKVTVNGSPSSTEH